MIVSITGGTGFIGRGLVLDHLARGHTVRLLSRRSPKDAGLPDLVMWHRGDLSSSTMLLSFLEGADVLYHCAAEIRDESLMQEVNVEGTRRLVEAATGRIGRWVQLSSVGAYGSYSQGVVTENSLLNPSGAYEVTKVEADALVETAALGGAFEHVILRPSNVYSAEMSNQSLFSLISMIQRNLFFYIGKPGASANYIHVDNVISALVLCGVHREAKGKIFNLSDYLTIEQFVASIALALGKPAPHRRLPKLMLQIAAKLACIIPKFPLTESRVNALTNSAIYLNDKIEREIGYKHVLQMEQGLKEIVEFWLLGNKK